MPVHKKATPVDIVEVPQKRLKILMVATEASPYASVGGAASVIGHLSRSLSKLGHDIAIFIPKFGFIDEEKFKITTLLTGLKVPTDDEGTPELICNIKTTTHCPGVQIYFLENQEYYEKRANVYGYSDDPTRWALLSRGVLEFIKTGKYVPDVIHCNDWHTGAVPNYLKTVYKKDPILSKISSIFTIHNLAYQGNFDHKNVSEMNFDDGKSLVTSFFSPRLPTLNFMKRGIIFADAVNTVSRTYSKEILTPEFGEGLEKLLLELKGKIFGIINGIDYDEFNPMTDNLIDVNYDIDMLDTRLQNKKALQKEYDLPVDESIPIFSFVGRLDLQKGLDLLIQTFHQVMKDYNVQFVQVGGGDGTITEMLKKFKDTYPDKVGIHPYPNFTLPRMLFAGADSFVYPSRFEPCGVAQIEAMRYGCIPIVRKVGGLSDTVEDFDSGKGTGTGFVFKDFNEFSLYGQVVRVIELYKNKKVWRKLQKNAMKMDYSWEYSAKEYIKLYERSVDFKYKKLTREKPMDYLM